MALWLVRPGRHGQHEQKFIDDNRIYMEWAHFQPDVSKIDSKQEVQELLLEEHPNWKKMKAVTGSGQIWAFGHRMQKGDWVVVPSRLKPAIHFAEITGPYKFDPQGGDSYRHFRDVKWLATDIPRSKFDQDLLYSFGAAMTICQITRNDAENRIRAMAKVSWTSAPPLSPRPGEEEEPEGEEPVDLERLGRDEIAKLIMAKFKGHGLANLVDGILRAQGYTTYVSPPGPDKGVDILAASGPLGFGQPRICVQVKSGDSAVDRPTLDQLIGTMQNVQAEQGLFVSWGGFKSSVDKEVAAQFFRVRLWNQDTLIEELLKHYNELDEDLRADLPLKRIWTVAEQDAEE